MKSKTLNLRARKTISLAYTGLTLREPGPPVTSPLKLKAYTGLPVKSKNYTQWGPSTTVCKLKHVWGNSVLSRCR